MYCNKNFEPIQHITCLGFHIRTVLRILLLPFQCFNHSNSLLARSTSNTRGHMRKISPDNHVYNVWVRLPYDHVDPSTTDFSNIRDHLSNCTWPLCKHTWPHFKHHFDLATLECLQLKIYAQLTWKCMSYTGTSQVLLAVSLLPKMIYAIWIFQTFSISNIFSCRQECDQWSQKWDDFISKTEMLKYVDSSNGKT